MMKSRLNSNHTGKSAPTTPSAGAARDKSRRQGLLQLGTLNQEAVGDRRGLSWLNSLLGDTRLAFCVFHKNPGFAAVAFLTLNLGFGVHRPAVTSGRMAGRHVPLVRRYLSIPSAPCVLRNGG